MREYAMDTEPKQPIATPVQKTSTQVGPIDAQKSLLQQLEALAKKCDNLSTQADHVAIMAQLEQLFIRDLPLAGRGQLPSLQRYLHATLSLIQLKKSPSFISSLQP